MLIIPSIDLRGGRCVRLRQGKFDQVDVYDYKVEDLIEKYVKQGASKLHIVDLDGAVAGEPQHQALLSPTILRSIAVQLGGGIRQIEHAKLWIAQGVKQIVLGSIAVTNPHLTQAIIETIGADQVILAIDVQMQQDRPIPMTHGWQQASQTTLWSLLEQYMSLGVRHILCTDIACDGMMQGPNFALYAEAIQRFTQGLWQASGGIRHFEDLQRLKTIGLSGAIIGRALYENTLNLQNCIQELSLC